MDGMDVAGQQTIYAEEEGVGKIDRPTPRSLKSKNKLDELITVVITTDNPDGFRSDLNGKDHIFSAGDEVQVSRFRANRWIKEGKAQIVNC